MTTAHTRKSHYWQLLIMAILSFIAMYVLMYAMVDVAANAHPNWNQFYMAGLMTAAMVVIEIALMRAMYHNKKLNMLIAAASIVMLISFWLFIREQTAIGDRQFLNSMIPHHAAAILMCERASIRDAEIKQLCQNILSSQQAEIDQMKALLRRYRSD
jgi:transcriptional regulator of nitric oxide reductase